MIGQAAEGRVVAIGEAMVEFAPADAGLYRRDFAGDTFNTAWHMAQISGQRVGFVTRVGADAVSDRFLAGAAADGLDISGIGRCPDRTMGLYLVELDGVERRFHYWRGQSAARTLAEDPAWLAEAIAGAGLIHLSGITVAILPAADRAALLEVITAARAGGAVVSFDPNVRLRLWSSIEDIRATLPAFLQACDIALPSFDDESPVWGDDTPEATCRRMAGLGVTEVIVKNGAEALTLLSGDTIDRIETPAVTGLRDTTGAGDAFNAGYLAARQVGQPPEGSARAGQLVSGAVICHPGARLPKAALPALRSGFEAIAGNVRP